MDEKPIASEEKRKDHRGEREREIKKDIGKKPVGGVVGNARHVRFRSGSLLFSCLLEQRNRRETRMTSRVLSEQGWPFLVPES